MADKKNYFGSTDLLALINLIKGEVDKYVKKVDGKSLSTEDFTTALKTKLEGIDLSVYAPLSNPALTGIPTAPTAAEGTNSTQIATTSFVVSAISRAISEVTGLRFEKVASVSALPTIGSLGVIYLVPKTLAGTDNVYTEYYWDGDTTSGKYEILGDTNIDLSNYLTNDDVTELTVAEVQAAWDIVFGE